MKHLTLFIGFSALLWAWVIQQYTMLWYFLLWFVWVTAIIYSINLAEKKACIEKDAEIEDYKSLVARLREWMFETDQELINALISVEKMEGQIRKLNFKLWKK